MHILILVPFTLQHYDKDAVYPRQALLARLVEIWLIAVVREFS
jgi:hypothetical protein